MQYLSKGKLRKHLNKKDILLLDGAHSNTSAKNLYNHLKTMKRPIYGIWAMQKNKDPSKFLKILKVYLKRLLQ